MAHVPECVVCLQAYNEYLRVPRLLSCGHSFCELCLKELESSSATSSGAVIQCPECSRRTVLPVAGHEFLPKNIELLRLLPKLIREPTVDVDDPPDSAALDEHTDDLQIRLQRWTIIDPPLTSQTWPLSMRTCFRRSAFGDSLPQGTELRVGESLVSSSADYTFTNHEDGNLCLRNDEQGYSLWESRTSRKGRGDLMLLTDGNLVLFDSEGTGKPIWASMSQGTAKAPGPFKLSMQDDGKLVIYGATHVPTWASWSDSSSGLFRDVADTAEMSGSVTWLQPCEKLVSSNGKYTFVNQGDGNLCIYKDGESIWASRTSNKGAGNLYMQADGDLVLYNTDGGGANPGARMWSSGTARKGRAPHRLVMEDHGHLVIYDANYTRTWASKSGSVWRSFTKSELQGSGSLHSGELLVSPEDKYSFVNQDDGNLVTYSKDGRATWESGTGPGRLTQRVLKLLADGNLVLFDIDGAGKPVWASMSQGNSRDTGPYKLCMQDDGNLVIYGANSGATWATRTPDTTSGLFTSVAGKAEMHGTVTWLQPCDKLVSRNGMYSFVNQRDGDLVIYKRNAKSTWSSGTSNRGAGNLYMQRDGNLVLYNTDGVVGTPGEVMWSSGTSGIGTAPYKLSMRDDGNLMILDRNYKPIWATNGFPEQTIDVLYSGDLLRTDEKLVSRNMIYTFVNQADGNLVVSNPRGATWASNTNNQGVGNLYMQRDGNLVLYHTSNNSSAPRAPIWSSGGRKGTAPFRLVMQDNGNLVIYDTADKPVWATNTNGT